MDEVEVAVMLADVSGSTALYEEIGNVAALQRVSGCLDLLRKVIEFHGGQFISSKGDDILCIFEHPKATLDVGMEMFEAMQANGLSLHAGVDFGRVIRARNDVFGDPVNMAARLAAVANSGEVLCSQELFDQLEGEYRSMLRFFGPRHFKGKTATSTIYLFSDAVPGQETEIIFTEATEQARADAVRLEDDGAKAALRFAHETFVCGVCKPITMGRSPDCDVIVPLPWISRKHATLEVRGDNVYLTDQSASGTYISFGAQPAVLARRETVLLHSSCTLSLARRPSDPGAQTISCELLVL